MNYLGPRPIFNGFIPIPVYTEKDNGGNEPSESLHKYACKTVQASKLKRVAYGNKYFMDHMFLVDKLKY